MASVLRSHISPGRIIVFSILIAIGIGTLLLSLPFARNVSIPLIDLFFTATSATCVTGLFTIPLEKFTMFGQCVILGLIQIGGIGLITITLVFVYLFVNVSLAANVMAGEILEIESWKQVRRTLLFIVLMTLFCEGIGALFIFNIIKENLSTGKAFFLSLFHAISSFCNAGIIANHAGLEQYGSNIWLIGITAFLMFAGGFGFITWYELTKWFLSFRRKKRHRLSLNSTIVVQVSLFLIACTTLLYLFLERTYSLKGFSLSFASFIALFHAISFKSTGLMLTNINTLQPATLFFLFFIAFIGSSPGSTGSGIKITTLTLFVSAIKATMSGRTAIELHNRRIPNDQIYRAIAIVSLSFFWILLSTFLLLLTEHSWSFRDTLFEAMSAFTTLGIPLGDTASLSLKGKFIIIASMIVGRIGSLTLLLSLKFRKKTEQVEFSYPEERVMLG